MTQSDPPAHRKAPVAINPISLTADSLRQQAEKRLLAQTLTGETAASQASDVQRLLHELQVHQIELEMQNEELTSARDTAEAAAIRYTDLYDFAPVGYLTLNAQGGITEINLAAAQLLGVERVHLVGKRIGAWMEQADLPAFNDFMKQVWVSGAESGHELVLSVKGQTITVQIDASLSDDAQQCRLVLMDITAIKAHQTQLEYIAHYDTLTGLPNRHLLSGQMQQAISHCQRYEQCLAVVYLDLDNVKLVNDQHGHDAGDALLIEVSKRMRSALREVDILARIGSDEFVVVLCELIHNQDSLPLIESLLNVVGASMTIRKTDLEMHPCSEFLLQISASIGVTFYPQDPVDADQLIRHADQAMYAAKQAGKNRYHLFDVASDTAMHTHHDDLKQIRQALNKQEFLLFYQPKVNMRTGRVTGVEALIRWQHPQQGLLSPSAFLPVVENHPMSVDMGEWVIDAALSQMSLWQARGMDIPVSVNIGALQLQHESFVTRLGQMLAKHPDVKPNSLEIEILETSAMQDIERVNGVMQACRALGLIFSLDDFGTGYSSLTYLKNLPAEVLKIDQSFVRNMTNSPDDFAIVKGVIGLADVFQLGVIAEGVETKAIGDMLLGIGCELAQGYGIARPMPAADIPAWVKCWHAGAQWTA